MFLMIPKLYILVHHVNVLIILFGAYVLCVFTCDAWLYFSASSRHRHGGKTCRTSLLIVTRSTVFE